MEALKLVVVGSEKYGLAVGKEKIVITNDEMIHFIAANGRRTK